MTAPTIDNINEFESAVLTDGMKLKNVRLTRATGYDTTVWVTDGTKFAPITQVVRLER